MRITDAYLELGAAKIKIYGSQSLTCFLPYSFYFNIKNPTHPDTVYALYDGGNVSIIRRSQSRRASLEAQSDIEPNIVGKITSIKGETYLGIKEGQAEAQAENGATAPVNSGEAVKMNPSGIFPVVVNAGCSIRWVDRGRVEIASAPGNAIAVDGVPQRRKVADINSTTIIEIEDVTGAQYKTKIRPGEYLVQKCE